MNTSGSVLHEKIARTTTIVVVVVMFHVIVWIRPFLASLASIYSIGTLAAGIVVSIGLYKSIAEFLHTIFKNVRPLRKRLLGSYFLEGTWAGHWIHEGRHFFTLEYIDQSSGDTHIVGRQFDADGVTLASWASDTVSIDLDRRQLVYAYTCKVFHRKHVHEGIGVFTMVTEAADQPPSKLDGYAVDLIDGDRDPNVEYKISDKPMDDKASLQRAREIFEVRAARQPDEDGKPEPGRAGACIDPRKACATHVSTGSLRGRTLPVRHIRTRNKRLGH